MGNKKVDNCIYVCQLKLNFENFHDKIFDFEFFIKQISVPKL